MKYELIKDFNEWFIIIKDGSKFITIHDKSEADKLMVMLNDYVEDPLFETNGKEYLMEEQAVAELMKKDLMFVNYRKYIENPWDEKPEISEKSTMVAFVICNDLFAWACADAEPVESEEDLISLWKEYKKDPINGTMIWCCKKRNLQPQYPIKRDWIRSGIWSDELEALKENL